MVLDRLLVTERLRHRATSTDFVSPVVHERLVRPDEAPFVVTNTRKGFVQTRRRPDSTIWAGFSELPLDDEPQVLQALYEFLWGLSLRNGWGNRCTSLAEAVPLMNSFGFEAHTLVVPVTLLTEACGTPVTELDAERLMQAQGYVAKVGKVHILGANLPEGTGLLTAAPPLVGSYTRSDQALALMLLRTDRAVVLLGKADGVA